MKISNNSRGFAVSCLLAMVLNIVLPSVAQAQNNGGAQPEFSGFSGGIGGAHVDPFTGDFSYSLPVLTVPGPNGGYPISLSYNAGPTMDQQASWVGLGWNLGAGAISREVRGLPDDFKDVDVIRKMNRKGSYNVSLKYIPNSTPADEVFGFESGVAQAYTIKYNSYTGIGFGYDYNKSTVLTSFGGSDYHKPSSLGQSTGISLDTDQGTGVNHSLTFSSGSFFKDAAKNRGGASSTLGVGLNYSSSTGLSSNVSRRHQANLVNDAARIGVNTSMNPTAFLFARAQPLPDYNVKTKGQNIAGNLKYKTSDTGSSTWEDKFQVAGTFSSEIIEDPVQVLRSYGAMYLEHGGDESYLDYVNENDVPLTRRVPNLPVPVLTHDLFHVSGYGISGTFKVQRNDVPILNEPSIVNSSKGHNGAVEAGYDPGVNWQVGVDYQVFNTYAYRGPWLSGLEPIKNEFNVHGLVNDDPLYKPFYFKFEGDRSAIDFSQYDQSQRDNLFAYKLYESKTKENLGNKTEKLKSKKAKVVWGSTNGIGQNVKSNLKKPQKSVQTIMYRTRGEMVNAISYWGSQYNRKVIVNDAMVPVDYTDDSEDLLGEITVQTAEGMKYVYGIPSMSKFEKEVAFANVNTDLGSPDANPVNHSYTDNWNEGEFENKEGEDHFISEATTPAHAKSFLLTEVVSADYVDLTSNGPSPDDFGYWTKFNYKKVHDNFKWRYPYRDAEYSKGEYHNILDDRGVYRYGEKEVHYLHSIETKTHKAVFYTSDRLDAMGVLSEDNAEDAGEDCQKLQRLDKIVLYAIGDVEMEFPIQTVNFSYSYSLCQGIHDNNSDNPENFNSYSGETEDNDGGKLTLEKIWITGQDDLSGKLTPYEFYYGDESDNPDYSVANVNRWGGYKSDMTYNNKECPYVDQRQSSKAQRNIDAGAWSLKKIKNPTGSWVNVEYEADDYAYVQDKRSMNMYKIIGTSKPDVAFPDVDSGQSKIRKKYTRIYFDVEDGQAENIDPESLEPGSENLYFKTWQKLKLKVPDGDGLVDHAYDYVEGFARIIPASLVIVADDGEYGDYGYFDVDKFSYRSGNAETHPFRMAGWQHLRYSRQDLQAQIEFDETQSISSIFANAIAEVHDLTLTSLQLLFQYYGTAQINRWCEFIDIGSTSKPSWVRLNAPNQMKYGGGHRVKSLTIRDNWEEDNVNSDYGVEGDDYVYGQYSSEIGTQYDYVRDDGKSSGVASYEPIVGGEENPLRQPIWFNASDGAIALGHRNLMAIRPLGESYYPTPMVGYSRIVKRGLEDRVNHLEEEIELSAKAGGGIIVDEFYTAKDFPVFVDYTHIGELDKTLVHQYVPVPIPGIGNSTFRNAGYSQAYLFEINNMHGAIRKNSTYSGLADLSSAEPVSSQEYIYNISETNPKRISSDVKVMDKSYEVTTQRIGSSQDYYIAQRDHLTFTSEIGGSGNIQDYNSPYIIIPTVFPDLSYSQSGMRSIVSSKVVYKTGIVKEVRSYHEGTRSKVANLVFDAESGTPLLTSSDNEFNEPIYTYVDKGHLVYNGMGGSDVGYRLNIRDFSVNVEGKLTSPKLDAFLDEGVPYSAFLTPGDVIVNPSCSNSQCRLWVVEVLDDHAMVIDLNNNQPGVLENINGYVERPGKTNLTTTNVGKIISPDSPIALQGFADFYNTAIDSYINNYDPNFPEDFDDILIKPHPDPESICPDCLYVNFIDLPECGGKPGSRVYVLHGVINTSQNAAIPFPESMTSCHHMTIVSEGPCGICSFSLRLGTNLASVEDFVLDCDENPTLATYIDLDPFLAIQSDPFQFEPFPHLGLRYQDDIFDGGLVNQQFCGDGFNNCFMSCFIPLHAEAITMSDQWNYNYFDENNPIDGNNNPLDIQSVNPYRYGIRGKWRVWASYLHQINREQQNWNSEYAGTNIGRDGLYETFTPFNWSSGNGENWKKMATTTAYSPNGQPLEAKDALNVYSSSIMGYEGSLVTALAENARSLEVGFDSFEDYSYSYESHGHLNFSVAVDIGSNLATVSDDYAHTGKKSLKFGPNGVSTFNMDFTDDSYRYFHPPAIYCHNCGGCNITNTKDYIISMWVKVDNSAGVEVTIKKGDIDLATVNSSQSPHPVIEGWQKLDLRFPISNGNIPVGAYDYELIIQNPTNEQTAIDDIRISPSESSMVTHVYDPFTFKLVATLDQNNFATLYDYDELGALIQQRKETYNGIVTLQMGQQNISKD